MVDRLYEPKDFCQLYTSLEGYLDLYHEVEDFHDINVDDMVYNIYLASQEAYRSSLSGCEDMPRALSKKSFYEEMGGDFPDCVSAPLLYKSLQYAKELLACSVQPPGVVMDNAEIINRHILHEHRHSKTHILNTRDYIEGEWSLVHDYDYQRPMPPIAVLISSPVEAEKGIMHGLWTQLPTTKKTMEVVFKKLHINPYISEYMVKAADVQVVKPFAFLQDAWQESHEVSLDMLNYVADGLSKLGLTDKKKLQAITEWGYISTPEDTARILNNLDCFEHNPGISSHYTLGEMLVDSATKTNQNAGLTMEQQELIDFARLYIDREELGHDHLADGGAAIVESGYICTRNSNILSEIGNGELAVPSGYCITPMVQNEKAKEGCR